MRNIFARLTDGRASTYKGPIPVELASLANLDYLYVAPAPHKTPRMPTTVPSAGGDGAPAQVPALQQPDGAHPGRADGAHPGRARQPHIPQSPVRHPGTSRYTANAHDRSVRGGWLRHRNLYENSLTGTIPAELE